MLRGFVDRHRPLLLCGALAVLPIGGLVAMGAGAFSPAPAAAPAASGVSVSSAQVPEEPAEATAMARCCLAIRQEARTAPPEQALMYGATLDICFEATGSRAGRTDPALAPRDALRIIRRNLGRTLLPRACDADGGTEP